MESWQSGLMRLIENQVVLCGLGGSNPPLENNLYQYRSGASPLFSNFQVWLVLDLVQAVRLKLNPCCF